VSDGHPLGKDGDVGITISVAGDLFATDLLDENGAPAGPRQTPFQSDVLLVIEEDSEVGHGAFVQVHIEPPEALALGPALDPAGEGAFDEDGVLPTCDVVDGAYRCRGNAEGLARFSVTSLGDYSGPAKIVVSWANETEEALMEISPAGLPIEATNFQLIGVSDDDKIPASFLRLQCTTDAVPDDLGDKWPAGGIRNRKIYARATPPPGAPGVLHNAPVIVETLSTEAGLSLTEDCSVRSSRLRLLLDTDGESPEIWVCFSDKGGPIGLALSSGAKPANAAITLNVIAEPRLLRVQVIDGQDLLEATQINEEVFEVTAYDVEFEPIPELDLDVSLEQETEILELTEASIELGDSPAVVDAIPRAPGTSQLAVTPGLLSEPRCLSGVVTVVAKP